MKMDLSNKRRDPFFKRKTSKELGKSLSSVVTFHLILQISCFMKHTSAFGDSASSQKYFQSTCILYSVIFYKKLVRVIIMSAVKPRTGSQQESKTDECNLFKNNFNLERKEKYYSEEKGSCVIINLEI